MFSLLKLLGWTERDPDPDPAALPTPFPNVCVHQGETAARTAAASGAAFGSLRTGLRTGLISTFHALEVTLAGFCHDWTKQNPTAVACGFDQGIDV